jgi:hypothetical protein
MTTRAKFRERRAARQKGAQERATAYAALTPAGQTAQQDRNRARWSATSGRTVYSEHPR